MIRLSRCWRPKPNWRGFKNEWEESSSNWSIQANISNVFSVKGGREMDYYPEEDVGLKDGLVVGGGGGGE